MMLRVPCFNIFLSHNIWVPLEGLRNRLGLALAEGLLKLVWVTDLRVQILDITYKKAGEGLSALTDGADLTIAVKRSGPAS